MAERNQNGIDLNHDVAAVVSESDLCREATSEFARWAAEGRPLDAKAFLDQHPEWKARKSVVLDLVYEEFCQRTESGESIAPAQFCRRFPTFEKSLCRLLSVHEFLREHSELMPAAGVDWPKPGQTFAGFLILEELGRGAFSRVYLAEEIALGRRSVAIKVSLQGSAEAEILGKLQHPNIVPVHSVQNDAQTGLSVICMPYLGPVTLLDILDTLFAAGAKPTKARSIVETLIAQAGRSPSPEPAAGSIQGKLGRGTFVDGAVYLGCQLAEALAYAHSRGVCHSDLKPSNVLVSPDGRPMLLDFNLAFDPNSFKRRLGGTLPYMAPEQIREMDDPGGEVGSVASYRSDIFSLGVILYELLSGQLPYGAVPAGLSWTQLRRWLLERQKSGPPPLREANDKVDPSLAKLVERCLAFDPRDRPESAEALAATLRRTISPACRVRRWTRQHRWLVRSLAVSFLIVCLGIGYHLSTREPYAIRQLNTGMEHYRQGEYADAEEHLTLALESPEVRAEALFWRARSRQKAGHTLLAMEDYEEAAKLCSAPEIKACQAYCSASEGYFSASIQFSKASLDSGFATAEVYNNLGYSYLHASDFESAMLALNEAIARDHSLQAAFYNRALAELRWAARLGRPVALQAATDIENAIAAGPPSAALYLDAARVYSRLGTESGEHGERIIGCLCEALRLGQSPDIIQREFKSQLDDPALKALLTHYLPEGQPRKAIGLVDPLADDSFRLVAGPAQVSQPF